MKIILELSFLYKYIHSLDGGKRYTVQYFIVVETLPDQIYYYNK